MNWRRRLALFAPLFVPSTALAPAVSAEGAVLPRPTCVLVEGAADQSGNTTYDIKLSGFTPNKYVEVASKKQKISISGTTSEAGDFSHTGVPYGNYVAVAYKDLKKPETTKPLKCSKPKQEKGKGKDKKGDINKEATVTAVALNLIAKTVVVEEGKVRLAVVGPEVTINTSTAGKVTYSFDVRVDPPSGGSGTTTVTFNEPGSKTERPGAPGVTAGCATPGQVIDYTGKVEITSGPSKGMLDEKKGQITCE
ncbi:hypothetical protein [Streptomyces sp. NPDC000410]|uniref:hypothetical protein n=1 Tax=Streptomyces sp. NPDC000410 TaxID=3154254 RepID=UPI00332388A8